LKTYHSDNAIEAPEEDYLYVGPSQIPEAGLGLFTAIKIYKDETIAIFHGEILNDEEATKREQKGMDRYFVNLIDGNILDSMHVACFAKYANDVNGGEKVKFKNNAILTLDENNAVCLTATRDIKAMEEIFCSYGKAYWKKHK